MQELGAFHFVAVDVLRTKQFICRIHSIDIVSLREIPAIVRRAFISIETGTPVYAIARRVGCKNCGHYYNIYVPILLLMSYGQNNTYIVFVLLTLFPYRKSLQLPIRHSYQ